MQIKYRCSHCNHTFELEEQEFHRCPNCFWTTSLVPREEGKPQTLSSTAQKPTSSQQRNPKKVIPWKLILVLALVVAVGGRGFVFFARNRQAFHFPSIQLPGSNFVRANLARGSAKSKPARAPETVFNQEELKELKQALQLTIPRKLSDDEEEILKKQVSSPAKLSEKPKITEWNKSDFGKLVESEQKKRKIMLGWLYVHSLTQVFEKNYLPGAKAFESGDYVLARDLFVKSLSFPTYQNDVKLHRAVVLVMLRPYLNDVIGKIAVINQYLLVQSLLTDASGIFGSYQAIFPVLELQEWDQALQMVANLKKQIEAFEGRPQSAQVNYPSAFSQIDAEIRSAIQTEAAPKPEAAVNLKALKIDLDLKEKLIRQNTSEELLKVQKQYEQALKMIEDLNWGAARDILQAIDFPPELASDAKKKLALVEKILTVQEANQK